MTSFHEKMKRIVIQFLDSNSPLSKIPNIFSWQRRTGTKSTSSNFQHVGILVSSKWANAVQKAHVWPSSFFNNMSLGSSLYHCIFNMLTYTIVNTCWNDLFSWVLSDPREAQFTAHEPTSMWCSHNTLWNQNDPFQSDPPTDKSKSCMPPTAWNCARGNKSDVRYPRYLLLQHQERKNVI